MKYIAIFFGGETVEHDISVISGVLTLNTLDKQKYIPVPIYINEVGEWFTGEKLFDLDSYKSLNIKELNKVVLRPGDNILYLEKKNKLKSGYPIACAINCLHGERGEDGSLSGYLKMCKIPLASPDMLASAISIDKAFTKIVLRSLGIKFLPCAELNAFEDISLAERKLGYPLILKPNTSGSSVGIKKAENRKELESAFNFASRFSEKVIAEKFLVDKIEINCACYKNSEDKIITSECERPFAGKDILSFDDKYVEGKREFPARIDKNLSSRIKEITEKIYKKLNFTGVIRIDYFIYEGEIYLNEINSVPGSLAYYLFSESLQGFSEILSDLILGAEKKFAITNTLKRKISTSILNVGGGKSSKRL